VTDHPERSCIGCKHWTFEGGHGAWSEVTPGDDWYASCVKGHWYMSGHDVTDGEWFKTMQAAKTCPDYDPRPGAPQ
jgi:hypothetical protein